MSGANQNSTDSSGKTAAEVVKNKGECHFETKEM